MQLEEGLGPEGVAHLGPADRDLGDPLRGLVADVAVAGVDDLPVGAGPDLAGRLVGSCVHGRLHSGSDHSYERRTVARRVPDRYPRPIAARAARPRDLRPMLAPRPTCRPVDDEHWAFEMKWDGMRALRRDRRRDA